MRSRNFGKAVVLLSFLLLVSFCAAFAEGKPALTLDPAELTLEKGKSQKLAVSLENVENPKKTKYVWESSDPNVATVDKNGGVRAKDGGSAVMTCTATLEDGSVLTASASVTVTVPVQSVKIQTKANTAIPFGESFQLEFAVQPENATDKTVTWQSSNEEVLRVDENGTVTAVSAGKANITGTSSNGKVARISLYVPTLSPSGDTFAVTAVDSVYYFTYCGNDFDKNVQISTKGKCFEYTLIRNDPDIGVSLIALAPGEGTLTVSDRKDAGAKFTVAVTVSEDAFPAGRRLLIKDAAYDPAVGMLTVSWTNTGSQTITGADLRVVPMDAEGNDLVIGEGYVEEILTEERVYHSTAVSAPGETVTASFRIGAAYPDAVSADISFDRLVFAVYAEDGTVAETIEQELPDDRLCWYSTGEKAYTAGPENGEPYSPPGEEAFDLADRMRLGVSTAPLTGELADSYGFAYGGLFIISLEVGLPADSIGLEPGDLIICANDLFYEQDPYFLVRALADLAEGKPAVLLIERGNEFYELTLNPEDMTETEVKNP